MDRELETSIMIICPKIGGGGGVQIWGLYTDYSVVGSILENPYVGKLQ